MEKRCLRCGEFIPKPTDPRKNYGSRKYHEACAKAVIREGKARIKRLNHARERLARREKRGRVTYHTTRERLEDLHAILSQLRSVDPRSVYTRYAEARLEQIGGRANA